MIIYKPYFGQEIIQLHYMHTDSFILSVNTNDIIKYLKNLEDMFDFSNLDENHLLFSNKKYQSAFSKSKFLELFGLMNSLSSEVKCILLDVEMIVKRN